MAKRASGRPSGTSGRVTPKGTGARSAMAKGAPAKDGSSKAGSSKDRAATSSGRYTPPIPREQKVSPRWVPVLMFVFLLSGAAMILLNYLGLLPGEADNRYLLGGLALITAGFITATRYH